MGKGEVTYMANRRNAYGNREPRTAGNTARAQAATAKALRPPPRAKGADPCRGAVPRRLAAKGGK